MVSKTKEDFPDPDKPVTTTSLSRGIEMSIFLRLWALAPSISIEFSINSKTQKYYFWNKETKVILGMKQDTI